MNMSKWWSFLVVLKVLALWLNEYVQGYPCLTPNQLTQPPMTRSRISGRKHVHMMKRLHCELCFSPLIWIYSDSYCADHTIEPHSVQMSQYHRLQIHISKAFWSYTAELGVSVEWTPSNTQTYRESSYHIRITSNGHPGLAYSTLSSLSVKFIKTQHSTFGLYLVHLFMLINIKTSAV